MASDIAAAVPGNGRAAPRSRRLRRYAVNLLRFASVLVGAGLLIRTGASEQASSAINGERRTRPAVPAIRDHNPQLTAAAVPKPAFGQPAAISGGIVPASTASARLAVSVRPAEIRAEAPAHLSRIAPAQDAAALAAPVANIAAARERSELVPAARPATVIDAPASMAAMQPAKANVAPVAQPAPSFVQPVAAKPAPATTPVQPPVARVTAIHPTTAPGLRAPMQTHSDIREVMNRPASAWDYADAPPAVTIPAQAAATRKSQVDTAPVPAAKPGAAVKPAAAAAKPLPATKPVAAVAKPGVLKSVAQAADKTPPTTLPTPVPVAPARPIASAHPAVPAEVPAPVPAKTVAMAAPRPVVPAPRQVQGQVAPHKPDPVGPAHAVELVRAAPAGPRPVAPTPRQQAAQMPPPAPKAAPPPSLETNRRAEGDMPKPAQSSAEPRPQEVAANNPYLPENNVAAAPVSKNALAYLAATAARTKPINAIASSAMARADTSAGGTGIRDRMPSPQF